jgi:hypothetical protein
MPAQFNSLGISFQYPDNWTLDDSDARLGRKSVTVYEPGGAFWSVTIHVGHADPSKVSAAVVDVMKQEYDSLEAEPREETIAGRNLLGFDLAFYCLDLTSTAWIRSLRVAKTTYTILCQAEDREFEKFRLVFLAMTTTLVQSLKDLNYSPEGA